jgi:hypothetical protein
MAARMQRRLGGRQRHDHAAIPVLQTSRQDLTAITDEVNDRPRRTTAGGNGTSTREYGGSNI